VNTWTGQGDVNEDHGELLCT